MLRNAPHDSKAVNTMSGGCAAGENDRREALRCIRDQVSGVR
jgi:hypothetical protein